MIKVLKLTVALILWFSTSLSLFSQAAELDPRHHIWFQQPAEKWDHALPVGNGRLGAMVFGGIEHERIQLNEDTIWAGKPTDKFNKGSREKLEYYRQALFASDYKTVDENIMKDFSINMEPKRSHQTLGELYLDFKHLDFKNFEVNVTGETTVPFQAESYRRSLELDKAIANVSFVNGDVRYTRETFASKPEQVLVTRLSSSDKSGMSFTLSLTRPTDNGHQTVAVTAKENTLNMSGQVSQYGGIDPDNGAGVKFYSLVYVKNEGGEVIARDNKLEILDAHNVEIYVAANSNFYSEDFESKTRIELEKAVALGWQKLKQNHIEDHQSLYKRSELRLPLVKSSYQPTDKRLANIKQGRKDPAFSSLYYHFGRYLLIASSRPGTQPANLQGLWNEHIRAPWNADYHVNINLQMNYWPADIANLSELQLPLFEFIERLAVRGEKRARDNFGARGWVSPHATDIWAAPWTRAVKTRWGLSHISNAWLLSHMVDNYRFSGDKGYLQNRVYPLLKGASQFYFDWLVPHPETNKLVSGPAASPENSFLVKEDGVWQQRAATMGPAMDQQVIGQLFTNTLFVASELGINDAFIEELKQVNQALSPGIRIADDGRIMEWFYPYPEAEPGHRHISHLYALYPGSEIHPLHTPDFANAARSTIDYRLKHGGAATGWSRAWMINFMARLSDGDAAKQHLDVLYQRSTSINLFDYHPPFQIDGNFGATAAIVEMLIQSHSGFIDLLPALPKDWPQGEIRGVKARGGFELDVQWQDNKLLTAALKAERTNVARVRFQGRAIQVTDVQGNHLSVTYGEHGIAEFHVEKAKTYYVSLATNT